MADLYFLKDGSESLCTAITTVENLIIEMGYNQDIQKDLTIAHACMRYVQDLNEEVSSAYE